MSRKSPPRGGHFDKFPSKITNVDGRFAVGKAGVERSPRAPSAALMSTLQQGRHRTGSVAFAFSGLIANALVGG
jgi:hypothetical protein